MSPLLTRMEDLRLRLHFTRVMREMRAVAPPEPASRARRAATVRELARYARADAFPRHGGRGAPRPVFIDAHGNRCAMAHLLEAHGHAGTVHRIAATRNHAYVAELARDPAISAAIRALGISEAEAARVQPCYSPSAAECLVAFLVQWAGAVSAVWMAAAGVRRLRPRTPGTPRQPAGRGRRMAAAALALLLVLLGASSYASTTRPEPATPGEMTFCAATEDFSVCGSGFSVPAVVRQVRAWGAE